MFALIFNLIVEDVEYIKRNRIIYPYILYLISTIINSRSNVYIFYTVTSYYFKVNLNMLFNPEVFH